MSGIISDDRKYVWHPFTQHQGAAEPLEIVSAEGVYLIDPKGKKYIDANSSWWVNVHGHGHPHIGQAIAEQFKQLDHVIFAGVTHPKAVELAKRIVNVLPDNLQKVFFSDNGSTSVEVALKMCFQFWYNQGMKKQRVLALDGSYHGDTFGAMSVGQRDYFNKPFEPFFFDVDYLPFPHKKDEALVLEQAREHFETGEFACVIVEPLVQGAAGMRMYSVDFLDELTLLARKNDVLIIFDEVFTGFGRTGRLFAMDHCTFKPDVVTLSKGLTGGVLPLGLTVASSSMFDAFLGDETAKALLHGHSFTGNAISCAAACASLDIFENPVTTTSIRQLSEWNETFAEELRSLASIEHVRTIGTILAFEVISDSGNSYFSDVRNTAYAHFLKEGVLLRPLGNTIFINPPYCLKKEEYQQIENAIRSILPH